MVVIRLSKKGQKGTPIYQILVADKDACLGGRYIEKLGTYSLVRGKKVLNLKQERFEHWVQKGAVPSTRLSTVLKQSLKATAPAVAAKATTAAKTAAAKSK